MPADLNSLTEGWLELESDPGEFKASFGKVRRQNTFNASFRTIYFIARGLWSEWCSGNHFVLSFNEPVAVIL